MTHGPRPVVALASRRDGPPWLAFHLAHELGHILLGHVVAGAEVLADGGLDKRSDDEYEQAADRFACEVLTGAPDGLHFKPTYGLRGRGLARLASEFVKQNRLPVDPGVLCLCYCRTADRWGVAQDALEELRAET